MKIEVPVVIRVYYWRVDLPQEHEKTVADLREKVGLIVDEVEEFALTTVRPLVELAQSRGGKL